MDHLSLEIRKLTKEYPGTVALNDFSAVLDGGKVYALLGKNGSGKSTLVKCLSGAEKPTQGELFLNGKKVHFESPIEAMKKGIALVYQELSLILDFTIAENIFIGRYPRLGSSSVIDWKTTNKNASLVLASLGIDLPVTTKVIDLSLGRKQMIEIAKAMSFNPSVLILDEPTSALARHESESLFRVIKSSRDKGLIVIFITHKLNEIRGVADEVIVLRDSRWIGSCPIQDATPKKIVEMMFGPVELLSRPDGLTPGAEVALEVKNLTRHNKFQQVSFSLHKGEILGIAGMLGSGRSELLRSIFGADPLDSGEVLVGGASVGRPSIRKMKKLGLAMTPENRKEEGLVQILSIRDNLCYASLKQIAPGGILSRKLQKPVVERWIRELQIKTGSPENPVSSLSGGNQQKIVVGNWLNTNPVIMFFDEPSRGIDVQAKQQIFQIMWNLSRHGIAVLFVSTELEELLEVCHRILIMKGGRIVSSVTPESLSLDELFAKCMED